MLCSKQNRTFCIVLYVSDTIVTLFVICVFMDKNEKNRGQQMLLSMNEVTCVDKLWYN